MLPCFLKPFGWFVALVLESIVSNAPKCPDIVASRQMNDVFKSLTIPRLPRSIFATPCSLALICAMSQQTPCASRMGCYSSKRTDFEP